MAFRPPTSISQNPQNPPALAAPPAPSPPHRTLPTGAPWQKPSRRAAAIFATKVALHRLRRHAQNLASGPPRLQKTNEPALATILAESRTPLRGEATLAELALQRGKIENLRVACAALHGTFIPANAVFSIWRQIGPPTARRGYVAGRMLQQGCIVPAIGGGLCQLSNALYQVALQTGCHIIERHAHSQIVPGSAAALGRDATIAWNYVDLRFSPKQNLHLHARLTAHHLVIRLLGQGQIPRATPPTQETPAPPPTSAPPRDCHSCNETTCFRHRPAAGPSGASAFLVDENWPEFQHFIQSARQATDPFGQPLNGARLGLARYAWPATQSRPGATATLAALRRAVALRQAASHGPARRAAELAGSERIAKSLARLLSPNIEAVTVAQSYLPFLHQSGALGGRDISVLMTRHPMAALHARLDAAAAAHPERANLTDFRAPAWLVAAETQALAEAAALITPHAGIAALFPGRAIQLAWHRPQPSLHQSGRRILFPGPTIARKGAHAVRAAAAALNLEIVPLGAEWEGPNFWAPVRTAPWRGWDDVAAVVQPAHIEDQPRRLLAALAAGKPVIATPACGLDPQAGLTLIPSDDPAALIAALEQILVESRLKKHFFF